MGGLGNQMFQYALYKSLELQERTKVRANILGYAEDRFNRDYELDKVFPNIQMSLDDADIFDKKKTRYLKARRKKDWVAYINYHVPGLCTYFKEKEPGVYDQRVLHLKRAALWGYWQSEQYFRNIRDYLLKDFTFAYGEEKLDIWRKRLCADRQSVSVHIRRGDYLDNIEMYGNLGESNYYDSAISMIKKRLYKPRFVFFSDEISWVKKKYNFADAVYVESGMFEHYESWYDMCLMSCCSHNIIANSSFSWWGAWLNQNDDKIVLAPSKWFFDDKSSKDICPENWIRIKIDND